MHASGKDIGSNADARQHASKFGATRPFTRDLPRGRTLYCRPLPSSTPVGSMDALVTWPIPSVVIQPHTPPVPPRVPAGSTDRSTLRRSPAAAPAAAALLVAGGRHLQVPSEGRNSMRALRPAVRTPRLPAVRILRRRRRRATPPSGTARPPSPQERCLARCALAEDRVRRGVTE